MNNLAERGFGFPDRSRRRSALAKLSAMMLVAVTEPADSEPKPPTRRKMTPSHMTAFRNRLAFDTVRRDYRKCIRLGNQEGTRSAFGERSGEVVDVGPHAEWQVAASRVDGENRPLKGYSALQDFAQASCLEGIACHEMRDEADA